VGAAFSMHSLSNIRRIQAIREGVACDLTLGGECPAGRDVNAHIHLLFIHQYEVVVHDANEDGFGAAVRRSWAARSGPKP